MVQVFAYLLFIYFGFFFLQKVDVEKWVCVSMDFQRSCDVNMCMCALPLIFFVWLPGVACSITFQNNVCVVMKKNGQVFI